MDFNVTCPDLNVEGFEANWISEILETTLNFFAGLLRPSFLITLQFVGRSDTGKQRLQNFNTPSTCYNYGDRRVVLLSLCCCIRI